MIASSTILLVTVFSFGGPAHGSHVRHPPLPGATVIVESPTATGAGGQSARTDHHGRAILHTRPGAYRVTVEMRPRGAAHTVVCSTPLTLTIGVHAVRKWLTVGCSLSATG